MTSATKLLFEFGVIFLGCFLWLASFQTRRFDLWFNFVDKSLRVSVIVKLSVARCRVSHLGEVVGSKVVMIWGLRRCLLVKSVICGVNGDAGFVRKLYVNLFSSNFVKSNLYLTGLDLDLSQAVRSSL